MKSHLVLAVVLLALTTYDFGDAQTYIAGTTYLSYQHNGSCGRMIGVDDSGNVHVDWTNASNTSLSTRHIFYNVWNPFIDEFSMPGGVQVDVATRAADATLAVKGAGFGFPVYHHTLGSVPNVAGAFDFAHRAGAFTESSLRILQEFGNPVSILWPKVAMGRDSILHVVSAESVVSGQPMRLFYSKGIPSFDQEGYCEAIEWHNFGFSDFFPLDTIRTLSYDIAASRVSNRVAIAYTRPPGILAPGMGMYNADLYLVVSEDNGLIWSDPINLTQFIAPESDCPFPSLNWRCCDRDTIRTSSDLSVLIDDQHNEIHVAFTTVGYYWRIGELEGPFIQPHKTIIWTWNENGNRFREVAEAWIKDSLLTHGQRLAPNHTLLERPCLTIDPVSRNLFCSYLKYDTAAYSTYGYLNADVWVSKSVDNAEHWSVGTNITRSTPAQIPAPFGTNRNEQDATMASQVVDGHLNLFYLLDRDAGPFETPSLNNMIFSRIGADTISATPLVAGRPLHVDLEPCDAIPQTSEPPATVHEFALHAAYPNPFNNVTTIRFDLPKSSPIELKVLNVLGQTVDVLQSGMASSGAHSVEWQPQSASSGVYLVMLITPDRTAITKVLLLK